MTDFVWRSVATDPEPRTEYLCTGHSAAIGQVWAQRWENIMPKGWYANRYKPRTELGPYETQDQAKAALIALIRLEV